MFPERPTLSLVTLFDQDDDSYVEEFSEYTKLNRTTAMALGERVDAIMASKDVLRMTTRSWKPYPGAPSVKLPTHTAPTDSFVDVVRRRRSVSTLGRDFVSGAIELEQLAGTLEMCYGPTTVIRSRDGEKIQELRATASGGGLYPTELYIVAMDVVGLEPGVYHYHPINHVLELISRGDPREQFVQAATYPGLAATCAVAIVMTSVMRRMLMKYRNRGYRFALIDAGGVCTQLYLAGTAMGLDTCALGGFFDDDVAAIVGVNPVDEPVQLCFLLGRRAEA